MFSQRATPAIFALCLSAGSAAGEEGAITCGFGRVERMLDSFRGIECQVNTKVTVKTARLNDGACESPASYMHRVNESGRSSGLPDFAAFKDFRRTYIAGEKFVLAVPVDCDVYSYTISLEGADLTWRVK